VKSAKFCNISSCHSHIVLLFRVEEDLVNNFAKLMYCDPEQKTEDVGEYFTCSKVDSSLIQ